MNRHCFLCNKPLPVEQRTTVFCSARCEERYRLLQAAAPASPPTARPAAGATKSGSPGAPPRRRG
ncbi:MAG: DUF2116 family Zn-ribbon domain-containing protein [Candidatus Lambdaproteobacteria bacterium]|nr:DUF2116 family Zn-ribbon domain-containing protein [Candidatus Lambdaproteobacteria bacterium]